jgi:hypothetical protein
MRALFLVLLAAVPAVSTFALPISTGSIARGKYYASGRASISGITVTYLPSSVHVNGHGRVKGYVARVVTTRAGQTLESSYVRLRGNLRNMHIRRGAFTADTVLHIADGAKIKGQFHGLVNSSQKLSRYFRGTISGSTNSNFKLSAR